MTKKTELEQVQDKFIAEIQKNGIKHTLEWVSGWYQQVANAVVEDDLNTALGEHAKDQEARELHLLDHLLPAASSNLNFSTSPGHNLLRQALVEARAEMLNQSQASVSVGGRRERWEEVRKRLVPEAAQN